MMTPAGIVSSFSPEYIPRDATEAAMVAAYHAQIAENERLFVEDAARWDTIRKNPVRARLAEMVGGGVMTYRETYKQLDREFRLTKSTDHARGMTAYYRLEKHIDARGACHDWSIFYWSQMGTARVCRREYLDRLRRRCAPTVPAQFAGWHRDAITAARAIRNRAAHVASLYEVAI